MSNTLKIHNSLSREKQGFMPRKGKIVKMYTCGVTVYDDCHIGHARSLYIFEVIRRYLKYRGFKVKFVRNITDIDDKIIKRANELGIDWKKLVDKYIDSYNKDLKRLDISKADLEPRATKNIKKMVKYIRALIKKGYAYQVEGDVYFRVRKSSQYGKLSNQNIDQMLEGVRIQPGDKKKDPLDFVLWKQFKQGEPSWPSPWGRGRPGWHIECSVMSREYLKTNTLDIHGGGRDLIFPHHENELAQSEALTGKVFANYWIHHGLLTINGQKMAKSLGNFVIINDVLDRYPADVLKMFYLQAHYSSSIDFSWEKMEEVKIAYERLVILKDRLDKKYAAVGVGKKVKVGTDFINAFRDEFIQAMNDDFNMPKALAVLFNLVNESNKIIDKEIEFKEVKLKYALDMIKEITSVFCLTFPHKVSSELADKEIEAKISARKEFKEQKKYQQADKIRQELEEKDIVLEDRKDGATEWRRKL